MRILVDTSIALSKPLKIINISQLTLLINKNILLQAPSIF